MRYILLFLFSILFTANASAEEFSEKCYKSPNFGCIISLAITSAKAAGDATVNAELLSHIVKLLVYNSQSSEAEDLISSVQNVSQPWVMGEIVAANFAIGKTEEGLTVLKKTVLKEREYSGDFTLGLVNLSKTYKLEKFKDKLKPIIIKIESLIRKKEKTEYKISQLTRLAKFYFNIGNSEKAEQLLQEAEKFTQTLRNMDNYKRSRALIAKAYVYVGMIKEGLAFSRSVIKDYQINYKSGIPPLLPQLDEAIDVLCRIAIYLHDNGNYIAATQILEEAKMAVSSAHTVDQTFPLLHIAKAFIKLNDINKAINISKLMEPSTQQGVVIDAIACHFREANDFDRAYKTLQNHKGNIAGRAQSVVKLALKEYREGAEILARKHLYAELDLLRQEKNGLDTDSSYNEIAKALAYIGDIEVALEIAKNANEKSFFNPNKISYYIAQSLVRANNISKAIEILKNVKGSYVKRNRRHYNQSWVLLRIAESLLEGDFPRVADYSTSCSGY